MIKPFIAMIGPCSEFRIASVTTSMKEAFETLLLGLVREPIFETSYIKSLTVLSKMKFVVLKWTF